MAALTPGGYDPANASPDNLPPIPTTDPRISSTVDNTMSLAKNDPTLVNSGVGGAGMGLLKQQSGQSEAQQLPDDFYSTLNQRAMNNNAQSVANITRLNDINAPVRQSALTSEASGQIAKKSQLDYNNWMLGTKQDLMKQQLAQAQKAAEGSFLSSILGLAGAAVGAGVVLATGGAALPAGAAAAAALGGATAGSAAGKAAGHAAAGA